MILDLQFCHSYRKIGGQGERAKPVLVKFHNKAVFLFESNPKALGFRQQDRNGFLFKECLIDFEVWGREKYEYFIDKGSYQKFKKN